MISSMFTEFYNHHHDLILEYFYPLPKYPSAVPPHSLQLIPMAWPSYYATCPFWTFQINGITWICNLLCLPSFTWPDVFQTHPRCSMCQYVIPFYGRIMSPCVEMTHFIYLFISWWTFGVVSTFRLLRMKVIWTCVEVSGYRFSLRSHWVVELPHHMATLCLMFWETAELFSPETALFCFTFPLAMNVGSNVPFTLPTHAIVCLSHYQPLWWVGSGNHIMVLTCISLPTPGASFHVLIGHSYTLFGAMPIQAFCPFFNWVVLWLSCESSSHIPNPRLSSDTQFATFFPSLQSCFDFCVVSFEVQMFLILIKPNLSIFYCLHDTLT